MSAVPPSLWVLCLFHYILRDKGGFVYYGKAYRWFSGIFFSGQDRVCIKFCATYPYRAIYTLLGGEFYALGRYQPFYIYYVDQSACDFVYGFLVMFAFYGRYSRVGDFFYGFYVFIGAGCLYARIIYFSSIYSIYGYQVYRTSPIRIEAYRLFCFI